MDKVLASEAIDPGSIPGGGTSLLSYNNGQEGNASKVRTEDAGRQIVAS